MITPKKNKKYQFDFLKVHKQLQEEIIRDIARRISVTDFTLTETARWQAEKAMQCGILYDEVLRQVGKKTAISRKEIEAIFDDARLEVFDYDEELLAVAGYSVQSVKNLSPAMKRIMAAAISKTRDDVENLTMTTAVTSQASYISACDLAHMQIVSGAFSYQDAIRNAIKRAAADGVSVIYPSGHESSLDAAVRRAVLTGVNQSCGRLQEMRATELGCDLMEITAHLGARPDHALWQGQVVSLSGRAGYLSLSDIGYGDVRGFQGANCRHNWYMFFEGVSSPAYSQEELREWREGTVSFDGVQIPLYEAVQKQRSMERAIRKSKQELVALDEAVKNAADEDAKIDLQLEFDRISVRLKEQEARLSDFCEKTGLDRDRYREQVFAAETERGIRGFGKSTSMKAVWANKKVLTTISKDGTINIEIDEFVPCLRKCSSGEIFETEVAKIKRSELSKYKAKDGWGVNWKDRPKNEDVFGVFIKGEDIPQGLISLRYDKGGTYIGFVSTAPNNNKLLVGDAQEYSGVGGHLFALGVEQSFNNGGNGTIYGFAVNKEVLEHYKKEFKAKHMPFQHPYQFIIEDTASEILLKKYNYTRRK